jgi:glycosyltransferase involved in cell wall biosynthesis
MRVAHFIQRYPPALGGSEAYFARLSRFLASQGDQVTVFTTNAIDLESFWSRHGRCVAAGTAHEDAVEVHRYPLWHWPARRFILKLLSLFPQRLWQCLTLPCNPISPAMWRAAGRPDQPYDIVHAAAFPYAWPIACARRLARLRKVPFFLTPFLHLGDPDDPHDSTRRGYTSPPLRWLLGQADAIFVQTPAEQQAARDLGVAHEKIILQGLGVDPGECTGGDRSAARQAWGLGANETVIGHLANKSREKGTVDLLEAAAELWQRGTAARILLAGPEMPNFRAYWQEFTRKLPEEAVSRVVRLGILDERQKRDFFAAIDIFALPSRSDSFGLVLLEAWANGVPNIAYRAGGIADVIRHEQDGVLIPCGAVSQLAAGLERLCADAATRRRLGQTGQERLARDFRWDDKLQLVRKAYADLAKERVRP